MISSRQIKQKGPGIMRPKQQQQNNDGWVNLITLLGTEKDSKTKTSFEGGKPLNEEEAANIYAENGVCRRIIEAYPKHGTRRWIDLENDDDDRFGKELRRIDAKKAFREAGIEARTFGGAYIAIYTEGKDNLKEPLDLSKPLVIEELEVFSRFDAKTTERYGPDDGKKSGRPMILECYRWDGSHATIHESRLIYFDGARATTRRRKLNDGYGDSVLTSIYESARAFGATLGYIETLIQSYDVPVLNVSGLASAIGGGNEDRIKKRFSFMNLGRSLLNMIVLDSEEKYSRGAASLTSIPEVVDRFASKLSSDSGIPVKILMGTSPAGLQSTGDADIRSFYDEIADYQVDQFEPNLERLLEIIATYIPYISPDRPPVVKWRPLWEPSEKEAAETRKIQADADAIYIDKSVVTPEEVRENRFVNGGGLNTAVESLEMEDMEDASGIEDPNEPEGNIEEQQTEGGED